MIIDAHTHPQVHPAQAFSSKPHAAEDYRRLAEPHGITKAGALVIAPAGDADTTRALNDAVLELEGTSNGYFFPVCSVHPFDGDAALQ